MPNIIDRLKTIEVPEAFSRQRMWELFAQGIFISAIRPPTVPPNTARLRLTVMATHRREDLDYTLEQLQKIAKELCLL